VKMLLVIPTEGIAGSELALQCRVIVYRYDC
jgi:hypothetical protein